MTDINTSKGPQNLTTQELIIMADEHISHYDNLISMSEINPNVRVGECSSLIRTWRAVKQAALNGLTYSDLKPWPAMRSEIADAYWDSVS